MCCCRAERTPLLWRWSWLPLVLVLRLEAAVMWVLVLKLVQVLVLKLVQVLVLKLVQGSVRLATVPSSTQSARFPRWTGSNCDRQQAHQHRH